MILDKFKASTRFIVIPILVICDSNDKKQKLENIYTDFLFITFNVPNISPLVTFLLCKIQIEEEIYKKNTLRVTERII